MKAYDTVHLPERSINHTAAMWWANLLLILIETTMFGLLIATYFYLRMYFEQWPPPRVDQFPIVHQPYPGLALSTINLGVMLLSLIPIAICDRSALRMDERKVITALQFCTLFIFTAIVLRYFEFDLIQFRWNQNAYAGVVWTLLGMHLAHMFIAFVEAVLMLAWNRKYGMEPRRALDVRLFIVYWYWIVGMWVLLYAIIYWGPRLMNS